MNNQHIEENKQGIETGDKVMVTFAWSDAPANSNFHFGEVESYEYKQVGNVFLLKFKVSGLENLVSADRIRLIEKAMVEMTNYAHVSERKASEAFHKAYSSGWRGEVIASNFNRDEFDVLSDSRNQYSVGLRFSDATDEVFATCTCLYFKNTKRLCKHAALVAIDELYAALEVRAAA